MGHGVLQERSVPTDLRARKVGTEASGLQGRCLGRVGCADAGMKCWSVLVRLTEAPCDGRRRSSDCPQFPPVFWSMAWGAANGGLRDGGLRKSEDI